MSGLRCRPGDLAVVVGASMTSELNGHFVIVESAAQEGETIDSGGFFVSARLMGHASWICRAPSEGGKLPATIINKLSGEKRLIQVDRRVIGDCILRPIRPSAGEDEMLRIAGKPRELADA